MSQGLQLLGINLIAATTEVVTPTPWLPFGSLKSSTSVI